MVKKLFKFILMTLICSFAVSHTAIADSNIENPYSSLRSSASYNNLIKSFKMRASLNPKSFYHKNIANFEAHVIDVLTEIYIFGKLKSEMGVPADVLNMYADPTPKGMLQEIEISLVKLRRSLGSDDIHFYTDTKIAALKMIFVAAQTISEFAPFLNLQDRVLKKILIDGFTRIVKMQSGIYMSDVEAYAKNPYLREVESSIKQMSKALSPPNIFQRIYTSLKPDQSLLEESQMGIGKTCSRIFQ
jgi:hypothetical protein